MQIFESGGALWIAPRMQMPTMLEIVGWAAVVMMAPPILALYLLIV